jgi:hypothetical protein
MKEVDDVIISSIHRITGNEYFKQLLLRQRQNCFSACSAKEPSTQKSRLWIFLSKMGRFSPLHRHEMFWTHWNLSSLRLFYDLAASGSETEYSYFFLIRCERFFYPTRKKKHLQI